MLDHLSIGVRDLKRSLTFYSELFAPLGYGCLRANEREVAFGTDENWAFWLYPTPDNATRVGERSHVAIRASSREALAAAHVAGMAGGGAVVRPPGPRPDISDDYYGCIMRDPDGHMIEILVR